MDDRTVIDVAVPETTAVDTVAVVDCPGWTVPEPGLTPTEKSFWLPPPLVNGANVWLKNHWLCWIPEQLSAAAPPGQLPLSRCRAQNEMPEIPVLRAQLSTVVASAVVNVSAGPKSSTPIISMMPTMPHSWAAVFVGYSLASWS